MPSRTIPLVTGEFYHVYNRGASHQPVFLNKRDYEKFIFTLSYYRFPHSLIKLSRFLKLPKEERGELMMGFEKTKERLVEIVSFVLMPNHFHLLLKQTTDQGISTYMRLVLDSWTRYFNTKHNRSGALFQGSFRALHIETDSQLIHLTRYIHLNPLVSYVVKEENFFSYLWSSLPDFLEGKSSLVKVDVILSQFSSLKAYKKFVLDRADYAKKLEEVKHLTLER